jgi:hypothetical protein
MHVLLKIYLFFFEVQPFSTTNEMSALFSKILADLFWLIWVFRRRCDRR